MQPGPFLNKFQKAKIMKRTENFKFLFPITAMAFRDGIFQMEHRGDLEVQYVGYHQPDNAGTEIEYDVDIDRVLTTGEDAGFNLRPYMETNEFGDLWTSIREAALNNVEYAFDALYQEEKGCEPVLLGKKWAS